MKELLSVFIIATFLVIQSTEKVEAETIFVSQEDLWCQKDEEAFQNNKLETIVLKIKDTSNEKIISSLELQKNSQVLKLKKQGNYLYALIQEIEKRQIIPGDTPLPQVKQKRKSLLIISLHNHLTPKIVSRIAIENHISSFSVDENHEKIHLINSKSKSGKLTVMNIRNLEKPKYEKAIHFKQQILNIESDAGKLYLATKKSLKIFNSTNLAKIGEIKNIGHTLSPLVQSNSYYSSLAFSDKFLAIGNYAGAIKVIDRISLATLTEFQFDLGAHDCLMNITIDERARLLIAKIDDDVYQMNYPKKEMRFSLDNLLFCYEKYQAFLFRKPTVEEIEQWLPLLENKEITQAGFAYLLVSTDEFKKKAQKIFPQLSKYQKDSARWKIMAMRFFVLGKNPTTSSIYEFHSLAIKGIF